MDKAEEARWHEIEKLWAEEDAREIEELGNWFRQKIKEKAQFTESIPIKPNGWLEIMDVNGTLKSYFAHMAGAPDKPEGSQVEQVYKLAFKIQDKCPDLSFRFDRDVEGKSITYTVTQRTNE